MFRFLNDFIYFEIYPAHIVYRDVYGFKTNSILYYIWKYLNRIRELLYLACQQQDEIRKDELEWILFLFFDDKFIFMYKDEILILTCYGQLHYYWDLTTAL
jgi:hypothetical protein